MTTSPLDQPDQLTPAEAEAQKTELLSLARQISDHQTHTLALSDRQMLTRYPGIKSTKTYSALKRDEIIISDIAAAIQSYRGTLTQIQNDIQSTTKDPVYPELSPAIAVNAAALSVMRQTGRERLVLVEGESGAGKTQSLQILAASHPHLVTMVEADEGWSRLGNAISGILIALGTPAADIPYHGAKGLPLMLDKLRSRRGLLVIDEGHHMAAASLNLIKSIINQTEWAVMLAAIPTLWRKLSHTAHEEANQLLHNRLHQRVRLAAPSPADIRHLLQQRLELNPDGLPSPRAIQALAQQAANHGHQAFVRRVINQLLDASAISDQALSDTALIEAIKAAKSEIA